MYNLFEGYNEFWLEYMAAHSKRNTKIFHVIGITMVILGVVSFFVTDFVSIGGVAILCGFAIAWVSHLMFEGNKPLMFSNPFFSVISGIRMYLLLITGRMVWGSK